MLGRLHGDACQLCGLAEQRVCREHQAGRDGSAAVGAAVVHHVDVGGRAKVHHDDGRTVRVPGGYGVGDAVRAHGAGVGHVDGHAVVVRRVDQQRASAQQVSQAAPPGARQRGHHAGHRRGRDVCQLVAVLEEVREQARVQHVGGVAGVARHAPALGQLPLVVKEAERGLRVADVDGKEHGDPP